MKLRSILAALLATGLGTLLAFGLAEGFLRLLPVNEGLRAMPVDVENPVFRFTPNRDVTWSRDWNFSIVNRIRVNNAGYVNTQDYVRQDSPLLAVVGDSYVEAAMVPYEDTLYGRAAATALDVGRVYSFAASGAPLSQYVVWAREAKAEWGANALVVVVIANDFDESLVEYKSAPGFHHYERDANGVLTLRRHDYSPNPLREVVRRSALFRYLVFNLQALERLKLLVREIGASPAQAQEFVGNTPAAASEKRLQDARDAIAAFLRDLVAVAGWTPSDVLFLVDGIRYPDPSPEVAASYFVKMREHFIAASRQQGFGVIDLDHAFFARHRADQSRFEFPTDAHWNAIAHGVAADALVNSALFERWARSSDGALAR
ncbi:MAG: hypothetical protein QNJ92_15225 [Alphaproteobacteria bacterium]|nr:hypothetical protein [Alphaproteobacteria bacterium]